MRGLFFRKKEKWTLTLWGKLTALAALTGIVGGVGQGMYPFLAVSSATHADTLVVEGWVREDSIAQVASVFSAEGYSNAVVVNAVYGEGNKWESGRYRGEYLTNTLARLGVPVERLALVHCDVVRKDRTYHAALAVREWLKGQGKAPQSLDVATLGPHARRSRLLYQKAFGPDTKIGVIALDEIDYDPAHWWRSSEGVREVLFEGVAYLYVRFFFSAGE